MSGPVRSLVLASASPRRRDLLQEHGYRFDIAPSSAPETVATTPHETVVENARRKAKVIAAVRTDPLVIGIDTEVWFAGRVFGKPGDMEHAFAMLSELNGKVHEVYSGVCLTWEGGQREETFVDVTRVHFHQRSDDELRAYLDRVGPLDKAGAYAAQEDRGVMIARVEGSFSNVIGLPMERLAVALAAHGIVPATAPAAS